MAAPRRFALIACEILQRSFELSNFVPSVSQPV
jgi:hypothetical protein